MKNGIYRLTEQDRPAMTAHFLRLSAGDRRLRFGLGMPDHALTEWCKGLRLAHMFGFFSHGILVAVMFLEPESANTSEFAVSVDSEYRGRGLGRQLLDYAVALHQGDSLVIYHAVENTAMARVHEGYRSRKSRHGGDIDVEIDVAAFEDEQVRAHGLACGAED